MPIHCVIEKLPLRYQMLLLRVHGSLLYHVMMLSGHLLLLVAPPIATMFGAVFAAGGRARRGRFGLLVVHDDI